MVDCSEIFADTSVLFNFAIDDNPKGAKELFEEHDCGKIVSQQVKEEFDGVRENREKIHRFLLEYASKDEVEEFRLSDIDGLSPNDRSYARELRDELVAMDEVEAVSRLREKRRNLDTAARELFEEGLIDEVLEGCSRDTQLKGYLGAVMENEADVRIVCDAVYWHRKMDGSGTFLASDKDDILGEESSEEDDATSDVDKIEDSEDEIPFEALLEDDRSMREKINEQIEQRYDSESTLDILSIHEFLDECS